MSEVAEILKRLQRENQEAREKFAGFQSRIFGAVLNGDDISEIVRDLTAESGQSSAEPMEVGDAHGAAGNSGSEVPPANEPVEPGSGESSSPSEALG